MGTDSLFQIYEMKLVAYLIKTLQTSVPVALVVQMEFIVLLN